MIRVVLVDDSAEIVSNIERMLFFEPDIEVIGTANDGETGLQLVRDTKPDVVMLDINMPGMDGLTTAQAITSSVPNTQVIMMSVQDDLDYLRRAMLAGARDYIIKPLDIDEVSNKVRQVYGLNRGKAAQEEPGAPEHSGRIVTVFSPRGGSGCSTLAVNLALALREFTRRKVVIVDASLQFGDVAVLLNLHDNRSIADLARRVDEVDAGFAAEMTLPHLSGVRALLAPPRPEGAELVTGDAMHHILEALRQGFDFVVVDAGHSVGDAALAAIDETDELLLLTTPDIPSIKSVRLMLEVLDALDVPDAKRRLVVSQAGRRYGVKVEDVERSLSARVCATLPYDDAGPLLAANQGRPVFEIDPETPLCRAIMDLAKQVTGGAAPVEVPAEAKAKSRGLLSVLGRK